MSKVKLDKKALGQKIRFETVHPDFIRALKTYLKKQPRVRKTPEYGILVRLDSGCVGMSVRYLTKEGYEKFYHEDSKFETITQWAKYHSSSE